MMYAICKIFVLSNAQIKANESLITGRLTQSSMWFRK